MFRALVAWGLDVGEHALSRASPPSASARKAAQLGVTSRWSPTLRLPGRLQFTSTKFHAELGRTCGDLPEGDAELNGFSLDHYKAGFQDFLKQLPTWGGVLETGSLSMFQRSYALCVEPDMPDKHLANHPRRCEGGLC